MAGPHDGVPYGRLIGEQATGDIYGNDQRTGLVEVFGQLCRQFIEGLVQPGAKQGIDNDFFFRNLVKLFGALQEMDIYREFMQPQQVSLKVWAAFFTEFQDVHFNGSAPLNQQSGYSQSVATVISFATENEETFLVQPVLNEPFYTAGRCPLHKINRGDRLIFYGKLVPTPDLFGRI